LNKQFSTQFKSPSSSQSSCLRCSSW